MESKLDRVQARLESGVHRKVWSSILLLSAITLETESLVEVSPVATRCVPKGMAFDSSGLRELV